MCYKLVFFAVVTLSNFVHAENLLGALQKTYKNNPKILAGREKYAAQRSLQDQAFSVFLPDVRIGYSQGNSEVGKTSGEFKNMQVSVEQTLFRGGELIGQYHAAKEALNAEKAQILLKEEEVLFEAISAYLEVIRDREIYKLNEHNVRTLEQYQERAKARYDLGDATRTDLAFAQSRLSATISEKLRAAAAVTSSESGYQQIIGEEPINLEMPQNMPQLPAKLEDAVETASRNNYALGAANSRQKAAQLSAKSASARLLPTISASFSATFDNKENMDKQIVSLNVSFPILNKGGSNIWKISEAKHNAGNARYEYLDAARTIKKAVTVAWKNIEVAKSAIKSSQDAINAAQIALLATQQEYDLGTKTMLDILDAERELFATRVNLTKAKHEHMILSYRLIFLMGMLNLSNITL
ncbi:type I secretion protein TolC [Rickettsiales bacterium]|nr:type I secretion protein TolC [Rickettsiales bacterium]